MGFGSTDELSCSVTSWDRRQEGPERAAMVPGLFNAMQD